MSDKQLNHDWLCPISSFRRLPYGENCPQAFTGCEGARNPNTTGAWYLRHQGERVADDVQVTGVGISKISDEDKE